MGGRYHGAASCSGIIQFNRNGCFTPLKQRFVQQSNQGHGIVQRTTALFPALALHTIYPAGRLLAKQFTRLIRSWQCFEIFT